jgi:hypothetical protein
VQKKTPPWSRIGVQAALVVALCAGILLARGRKPEDDNDDHDNFPDYNKIEMHPKQTRQTSSAPTPPASSPAVVPSQPPTHLSTAALNGEDMDHPRPAPQAVPSKDESEPAMPDDITNTLEKSPKK